MKLRDISILCVGVLISCALIGCGGSPKEAGRYYDKNNGFSIKIPDGWKKQKPFPGFTVQFSNPDNRSTIGFTVKKNSKQTSSELFDKMLSLVKSNGGRKTGDGQIVIDGYDAYWFTCVMRNEGILYNFIGKENILYGMSFACDKDEFSSDFEDSMIEVAKSFRFEK